MRKGIGLLSTLVVMVAGAGIAFEQTSARAAETGQVSIVDADSDAMKWRYEPAEITVPVGSTVLWRNDGNQPHTVTADDKSFDSSYLSSGQEFQWNFSSPGEFSYYCEPHPWMKAVVRVVEGGSNPAPAPAPTPAPPAPAPAPAKPPANPAPAPAPKAAAAPAPATQAGAAAAPASTTTTTAAAVAAHNDAAATTTTEPNAPGERSDAAPAGEEAAVAEGGGLGSEPEDYNGVAIGFAVAATLACMALGLRLLLGKA